jgi:MraZ protein
MFKGRYNYSVDSKGRTSFPSRFREGLYPEDESRVVITSALDSQFPHLDVYPLRRWLEFEEKLAAKPIFNQNVIMLKRLYVANAVECTLDSHGRILIAPPLRAAAGIQGESIWVGMTRIVELWSPEHWELAQTEALAQINDVRQGLAEFDL